MARFATLTALLTIAGVASAAQVKSSLTRRTDTTNTIPVACYSPANPGDACDCPVDLTNNYGVLINYYPGFQCAYPGGACTYNDKDGSLVNTNQGNCVSEAQPCSAGSCTCPTDNNEDTGVLINSFTGYQCAYPNGACTWDFDGNLSNTAQSNCPKSAICVKPASRRREL